MVSFVDLCHSRINLWLWLFQLLGGVAFSHDAGSSLFDGLSLFLTYELDLVDFVEGVGFTANFIYLNLRRLQPLHVVLIVALFVKARQRALEFSI